MYAVPWESKKLWNTFAGDLCSRLYVNSVQVDLLSYVGDSTPLCGKTPTHAPAICLLHNFSAKAYDPLRGTNIVLPKSVRQPLSAAAVHSDQYPLSFCQNFLTISVDTVKATRGNDLRQMPCVDPPQIRLISELLDPRTDKELDLLSRPND